MKKEPSFLHIHFKIVYIKNMWFNLVQILIQRERERERERKREREGWRETDVITTIIGFFTSTGWIVYDVKSV